MSNWNLRLIGYNDDLSIGLQLNFDGRNQVSLNRIQLLAFALFPTVVAVVAFDEPTEQVGQYAPYTLTVNGVVQPGGGGPIT